MLAIGLLTAWLIVFLWASVQAYRDARRREAFDQMVTDCYLPRCYLCAGRLERAAEYVGGGLVLCGACATLTPAAEVTP